jgi:hypothetical protein
VIASYDELDFDRAVAVVSAEPSPEALVRRLGLDWDYVGWIALDVSTVVLAELEEPGAAAVGYGGEAFTAGFLIGLHLPPGRTLVQDRLPQAVAAVQEQGRHAVIAAHCDLAAVARLEDVFAGALVESIEGGRDALRGPLTRIFEAGLAVGLELSGSERAGAPEA